MESKVAAVLAALERWVGKGLLDADTAAILRSEAEKEVERSGRRLSQYALSGTAALILLVAIGVLADWLWPMLGVGTRSMVLAVVGVLIHQLGVTLERRRRWVPASYVLQTTGMLVALIACLYSGEEWPRATMGGVIVGVLALVAPLLLIPRALGRNPVMPAVHLALGFGFLATFLYRATTISGDAIIWVLDGVLFVMVAVLVRQLARVTERASADTVLYAFMTAVYGAFVLIILTGLGPLDVSQDAVWGLDVWLAVVVALSLWGIFRSPEALRRDWFEEQLGACVAISIPLAFWTLLGPLGMDDVGPEPTALVVAAIGAGGLWYAVPRGSETVLGTSSLALLIAACYYGFGRAGAIGAVIALGFTAALLFWLSAHIGRKAEEIT